MTYDNCNQTRYFGTIGCDAIITIFTSYLSTKGTFIDKVPNK